MDSSSDPSTPAYTDSLEWITAYLTIHSLSIPSRRYTFLLWLAVLFVFLSLTVLHWTSSRGCFLHAVWSKWALRRRTWRKKRALALAQRTNHPHHQPTVLPSNAQLLFLAVFILTSLVLASVGPDYLAPDLQVWQVQSRSASPPSQSYDMSTFIPLRPQYTIYKSFWSSSARVGQIAFALFPLCVLFALKAPPFAIFALPFTTQIYFDKLAWLHKWTGRLIWLLVAVHVGFWCIQLTKDVNPSTGRIAFVYAWSYTPFIFGWIAFALLTLVVLTSLRPIRRRYYEHFYILHLLLVPSMLVMAALHHPTVSWWCWAALAIWFGERLWRGIWWIYTNGILGGVGPPPFPSNFTTYPKDTLEMGRIRHFSVTSAASNFSPDGRSPSPLEAHYLHDKSHIPADQLHWTIRPNSFPPSSEHDLCGIPNSHLPSPYSPPPGYAHAEILSGRTVRLRLITSGFVSWSPGQHFLLCIPSISRFTSHPFTCATVCDEQGPTDAGRIMEFLVRAKSGWTETLWNLVSRLTGARGRGDVSLSDGLPRHGVLLRVFVDGPFGSSKRARWDDHSTAIIITGGSGVSYGLSLLQYMCMSLSGRDGRYLGGQLDRSGRKSGNLKRVRFIWLIREYSHIQWCASTIRRCMSIVPPSVLQVDIYVTTFKPIPKNHGPLVSRFSADLSEVDEELHPARLSFAQETSARIDSGPSESLQSHDSHESDVDLSYYLGDHPDDEPPADQICITHETNVLDLTNFDGDVDMVSVRDTYLNRRLKKEGKVRRRQSYRKSRAEGMNQDAGLSHLLSRSDAQQTRHGQDSYRAFPSTVRLLPPLSERPDPAPSETDYQSAFSSYSETSFHSYAPPNSVPLSSDLTSTVSLVSTNENSRLHGHPAKKPRKLRKPRVDQMPTLKTTAHPHESNLTPISTEPLGSISPLPFEMDEQEAIDINVVSEYARPGKPKFHKVIADEVQTSTGPIVVACCGPRSLNAVVRKIIATQIDPGRIRKGDMRGSIALVSEEFDY
ncbi:ferric reductase like transmembrane component-domain-containing protein [Chiua virens]|nr:ferric reductase like transmembrane component-domain-containing protein [Chiua virens]